MSDESDEWQRAARAGAERRRRALLKSALGIAGVLAIAGAVAGWMWWDEVGSRKKNGDACASHAECIVDSVCLDGRCRRACGDDLKCEAGLSCVEVPVVSVTDLGNSQGGGWRTLCVPEQDATRYVKERRDSFQKQPFGR